MIIIALFFTIGGIAHFVLIDKFISIMPSYLGYPKQLVIISGIFELLGAMGILFSQTRRFAGYGLIALIVAVYPANIHMALHAQDYPTIPEMVLWLRLPLQFFFVWFVWRAIK
ncbi:MAG TPA: hypothetical protein ENI24_01220 [Methylophaga sp.]|nr:hypothetical protein [Methylophaga sp.]